MTFRKKGQIKVRHNLVIIRHYQKLSDPKYSWNKVHMRISRSHGHMAPDITCPINLISSFNETVIQLNGGYVCGEIEIQ